MGRTGKISARDVALDLIAIGGAAAITYGVFLIFPPAGWIVGGALALAAAILANVAE